MSRKRETSGPSLFAHAAKEGRLGAPAPLAERMRPRTLDEVVGQSHLLGPSGMLSRAIHSDRIPSMILWGDPGSGKTTLAHVISRATQASFESFSAVLGGVAELREIIARAKERLELEGKRTLLFVDEIHRFNRAQQDAFLPHVENGTIVLIGATTENPSFAVNAAVLSRAKVFKLRALEPAELVVLLERALCEPERGLGSSVLATSDALAAICKLAGGDARRALTTLETAASFVSSGTADGEVPTITVEALTQMDDEPSLLYDKSGEQHYNVVSALIKSMRGSDPDAAIYWLMRMVEAGDDPLFIMRRLLIFASEDVGNADPRALEVAVNADAAYRRLGMPEGMYPMAHACIYLASCPKSNAVNAAWHAAQKAVKEHGSLPVPNKLRNAVTSLMKDEGYGKGYQYAHNTPGHHVPGETYLPDALTGERYYEPSNQGLEQAIGERLQRLRTPPADSKS